MREGYEGGRAPAVPEHGRLDGSDVRPCAPPTLAARRVRPVPRRRPSRTSWPWPRPEPARRRSPWPAPVRARRPARRRAPDAWSSSPRPATSSCSGPGRAPPRPGARPGWTPAGGVAKDVHGIVTTYQQVATGDTAKRLRALADDAFVDPRRGPPRRRRAAWGTSVRTAFEPAARRLCLSGTPFRSDTAPIPFVRYAETAEGTEAQPDYTYGYADALRDGGVVRPVYFPRFDGIMEWTLAGRRGAARRLPGRARPRRRGPATARRVEPRRRVAAERARARRTSG